MRRFNVEVEVSRCIDAEKGIFITGHDSFWSDYDDLDEDEVRDRIDYIRWDEQEEDYAEDYNFSHRILHDDEIVNVEYYAGDGV